MFTRGVRGLAVVGIVVVAGVSASCTAAVPRGTFVVPDAPCTDATLLWARGSSEPVDGGDLADLQRHLGSAMAAVAPNATFDALELGDLDHDGVLDDGGYPAPTGFALLGFDTHADPGRELPVIGGYNESTRIGADELASVIATRHSRCPDQVFVVSGKSQGADAVMKGLARLPAELVGTVAAVHVFGDPGVAVGPWMVAPDAVIPLGHGLLGPRVPYVPPTLEHRTTSWCAQYDGVCTGQFWLSILDRVDACEERRDLRVCTRRHIDYSIWAFEPAMQSAATAVAAHI